MGDNGCELAVEVGGEPEPGLEAVHDVPGGRGAQSVLADVVSKVLLVSEQPRHVAVVGHALGPVMTQHDVGGIVRQLLQPTYNVTLVSWTIQI